MAALFPAQVAALQVGSYFVGQYYILVQQEPNLVHRFYGDVSTMTRFDGARADSAAGMMQIHNLIMRFNYTGVEIKSAHSVESWNGGILVMVSGSVQTKDSINMRKFAQTFFLAPQEKGYFVLNDIFQFIDDDQLHPHPTTILTQTNYESTVVASNPITEPVVPSYLREENQTINYASSIPMEQAETVDKYSIPDPPQKVPEPSPTVVVRELPLTQEESVGEPAKHTYASILQKTKTQSAPSISQNTSSNGTFKESSEWQFAQQAYQQSQTASNIQPEISSVETVEESAALEDEGEQKSVYVGNLSSGTTIAELELEFRNFGKLRPEGVVIRSRKETGAYYAFVEFEDSTGVVNAIKASPVQVGGRLLHVEGRRTNNYSYRGGRGRGRGRGGYGSDAPRGRYNNRTYGRGNGGYENNNRDYSNRLRGKGYHQRSQERGILGNQNQWVGQDQDE